MKIIGQLVENVVSDYLNQNGELIKMLMYVQIVVNKLPIKFQTLPVYFINQIMFSIHPHDMRQNTF